MKALKLKGLWCVISNIDGETEVNHIQYERKPSIKKALILAYGLDEDDEELKLLLTQKVTVIPVILYNEPYVKIEQVKISV
jgi:hypothetical protein